MFQFSAPVGFVHNAAYFANIDAINIGRKNQDKCRSRFEVASDFQDIFKLPEAHRLVNPADLPRAFDGHTDVRKEVPIAVSGCSPMTQRRSTMFGIGLWLCATNQGCNRANRHSKTLGNHRIQLNHLILRLSIPLTQSPRSPQARPPRRLRSWRSLRRGVSSARSLSVWRRRGRRWRGRTSRGRSRCAGR